jgi:DDE family transposase
MLGQRASASLRTPTVERVVERKKSGYQNPKVPIGSITACRENADRKERLGLSELIEQHLTDSRGKNRQLPLADLLRQRVYSRLAGYEDVNDAERLSQDPTLRLIGSEKIWERGAALTSRLQSFETEVLARDEHLAGLEAINRGLMAQSEAIDSSQRVVLDMDSSEIQVYGQQEHSACNGHFESTCYHPLLLFNGEGDCLAAKLRPGNVHSAED